MAVAERLASFTPYAGDVSPKDAWEQLSKNAPAQFIDVRTAPEWTYAGLPHLERIGKKAHTISYKLYPNFEVNSSFLAQLEQAVPDKTAPLYFMCRGGGRSRDAAMLATTAGWQECYNVAGGFDGSANEDHQRGTIDGWKASGLPWVHP